MNGFKASVIIEVYADFYRGEYVLNCPYCHELNILPDSNRGYRICGSCKQIFNVR